MKNFLIILIGLLFTSTVNGQEVIGKDTYSYEVPRIEKIVKGVRVRMPQTIDILKVEEEVFDMMRDKNLRGIGIVGLAQKEMPVGTHRDVLLREFQRFDYKVHPMSDPNYNNPHNKSDEIWDEGWTVTKNIPTWYNFFTFSNREIVFNMVFKDKKLGFISGYVANHYL